MKDWHKNSTPPLKGTFWKVTHLFFSHSHHLVHRSHLGNLKVDIMAAKETSSLAFHVIIVPMYCTVVYIARSIVL